MDQNKNKGAAGSGLEMLVRDEAGETERSLNETIGIGSSNSNADITVQSKTITLPSATTLHNNNGSGSGSGRGNGRPGLPGIARLLADGFESSPVNLNDPAGGGGSTSTNAITITAAESNKNLNVNSNILPAADYQRYALAPLPPPNQHFAHVTPSSYRSTLPGPSGSFRDPRSPHHSFLFPGPASGSADGASFQNSSQKPHLFSCGFNQQPDILSPNQQTILPPLRAISNSMSHASAHAPPRHYQSQFQDTAQRFPEYPHQNYHQNQSNSLQSGSTQHVSYSQGSYHHTPQQQQQQQQQHQQSLPPPYHFQDPVFYHHQQQQQQQYHQHQKIVSSSPTSQIYAQQFDRKFSSAPSIPVYQTQTSQRQHSLTQVPLRGRPQYHQHNGGVVTSKSNLQQLQQIQTPSQAQLQTQSQSQQKQQKQEREHQQRKRETARRYRLSRPQITCLTKLFEVDPSPSANLHLKIAEVTGMPRKAVRLWFQNARAKLRREARMEGFRDPNTPSELKKYQYFLSTRSPDDPLPPRRRHSSDAAVVVGVGSGGSGGIGGSGSSGGGANDDDGEGFRSYDDDGHAIVPLKSMIAISKEICDILGAYENGEFGVVVPNLFVANSGVGPTRGVGGSHIVSGNANTRYANGKHGRDDDDDDDVDDEDDEDDGSEYN
ncbi:hypothetical protein HK100_012928 [Physocladia obscura]|uniref:Homeobox domain-containing protein n=1 Tax=Physocladia obscura TaxID=109957 RepID=A0AAD5XLU4_9FUNG|nr:hypothetical protein HK100_012928 [Physocladia obscura]